MYLQWVFLGSNPTYPSRKDSGANNTNMCIHCVTIFHRFTMFHYFNWKKIKKIIYLFLFFIFIFHFKVINLNRLKCQSTTLVILIYIQLKFFSRKIDSKFSILHREWFSIGSDLSLIRVEADWKSDWEFSSIENFRRLKNKSDWKLQSKNDWKFPAKPIALVWKIFNPTGEWFSIPKDLSLIRVGGRLKFRIDSIEISIFQI